MYKIEKGIPSPRLGSGSKVYPFNEMEVGDSFFVPYSDRDSKKVQANIIVSVRNRRGLPKEFKVRTRSILTGVRCWRVK